MKILKVGVGKMLTEEVGLRKNLVDFDQESKVIILIMS